MRRAAVFAFAISLAPLCATAKPWQQMTPEEGMRARNAIMPYVMATIDCIAGAIPGNPQAVQWARKKKWLYAASVTGNACDRSFHQMEAAIDAVFEAGEGHRYTLTHFKKELPMYLAQRVRLPRPVPAIAATPHTAPVAAAPPVDPEAEAAKKKLIDAASEKQMTCIRAATADLVPYSNESAETLGTVIMAKCAQFEAEQVDVAVAAYGLTKDNATRINATISAQMRQKIVEQIVTVRAEAAKAASAPPEKQGFKPPSDGVVNAGKSY